MLGVGKPQDREETQHHLEGWPGPRQRLERPSPSLRGVLVGGKEAFLIDRTQTATWKVKRKQDLGSLTRKIILFRD